MKAFMDFFLLKSPPISSPHRLGGYQEAESPKLFKYMVGLRGTVIPFLRHLRINSQVV